MHNITDNSADPAVIALHHIHARITQAALESGRKAADIALTAVSKTFDDTAILPVLHARHRIFGENRVQEAKTKWPQLRRQFPDIELHLIGPLQSNKAAEAIALFDVIETVDREKIAAALAQEVQKQQKQMRFYVQVNTGLEPQKAGIAPQETVAFVKHCQEHHNLTIEGLMCVPPVAENPGPHFALLTKLGQQAGLARFSMGMSGDFETAIAFGATSVRVGSAIFGHRNYTPPL